MKLTVTRKPAALTLFCIAVLACVVALQTRVLNDQVWEHRDQYLKAQGDAVVTIVVSLTADLVFEISAGCREQAVGIEQIDQVTQSNARGPTRCRPPQRTCP